ncbi:GumC family protein [Vulgatibacter sp.]|uniref:GumC family protein n=1 Tax=Vulgatibacter sp. TaxID=1971226 RepID=UPI0035676320
MEHGNEKSLSLEELLSGVWRRRKIALLVTAAALVIGALYVAATPKKYGASTVVRIDMQRLPEQYVSSTVSESVMDRLATVRHELLSLPVLSKAIEEFDLYRSAREAGGMNAAVQAMRGNLEVKVEGENAFVITYQAKDPALAAQVANRLPDLYAAQALEERAAAAERAAAIFSAELEKIRPRVEEYESKLTAFKSEHGLNLPEVLESNIRQIDRLSGLTETTLMSLADAQRRRTALARLGAESNVEVGRLAAIRNDARRELSGLESMYTPDHPTVVAARRSWEQAQARYNAAAEAAANGDNEQKRVDTEIASLKETALSFQQRMDEYMKRIESTPAVGAQLAAINRDYDAVREKYQTLLSRKVEAELAMDFEARQKASLFNVVEPAFASAAPLEPNPVSAMGMSLLLGLGLGIAAAVYSASRDTSIRGAADARQRLGLPVLAMVPNLDRKIRKSS